MKKRLLLLPFFNADVGADAAARSIDSSLSLQRKKEGKKKTKGSFSLYLFFSTGVRWSPPSAAAADDDAAGAAGFPPRECVAKRE